MKEGDAVIMKRRALLFLAVFLFLSVSVTANAARNTASKENPYAYAEGMEDENTGNQSMTFNIPSKYSEQVFTILQNDPQYDWPWKHIEDPVHHVYGYYTSMGCDDVACTDPAHTHWCPDCICQNADHGHSEEEYAGAAMRNSYRNALTVAEPVY